MLTHHSLNDCEKSYFIELYLDVESKYPLFNLIRSSRQTMIIWFTIINLFFWTLLLIFHAILDYKSLVNFFIGIIGLQIVFVAAHIKSHALFLEYNLHVPGNQIVSSQPPIYFYAFYHHHHNRKNDWAPFLSYYDNTNSFVLDHLGTRNITAAHWHGFSLVSSFGIIIILLFAIIETKSILYFYGYEIGVILLPFAHGWQHIPHKRFGKLRYLFMFLEKCRLFANQKDHGKHHIHTTPTVYQDFSSSGIYAKVIDHSLNRFWNYIYYKYSRPHSIMEPMANIVYLIAIIIVPVLIIIH